MEGIPNKMLGPETTSKCIIMFKLMRVTHSITRTLNFLLKWTQICRGHENCNF